MKLLTLGNTKTVKGEAMGFQTYIMHLAPSTLSGYNTCPMASEDVLPLVSIRQVVVASPPSKRLASARRGGSLRTARILCIRW